jgi:hypothetical protein
VWPGTPTGFANTPASWPLPDLGLPTDWLNDLSEDTATGCFSGTVTFSTVDLTGDGVPDLVQTDSCADADVGTSEWRVFPAACEQ